MGIPFEDRLSDHGAWDRVREYGIHSNPPQRIAHPEMLAHMQKFICKKIYTTV